MASVEPSSCFYEKVHQVKLKYGKCALRHPYQMRARARVMGEVEEVQEQIKIDMEAMKEQMATIMEAMMSMKKIMEVNAAAIATTSTIAEVDLTSPSGLNQMNHPTSDMVCLGGKELEDPGGPHLVRKNKHAFLPYGLPPNYTPPNMAYNPNENVNNSTPILIENQQPQSDHAHEFWSFRIVLGIMFYYEKMVGYAPSSFADLVFASERIEVEANLNHPAWTNEKTGGNEEGENEGETHAMIVIPTWPNFPPAQQCYYSTNISSSHYPPPRYDSNATCAYHGGVSGHSIEHCMTSKRKVQSLIDVGWLKHEENRFPHLLHFKTKVACIWIPKNHVNYIDFLHLLSNLFEFGMTGPLNESITCFLIRDYTSSPSEGYTSSPSEGYTPSPSEDYTSLPSEGYTPSAFRGLHVLTFRGLHVLNFIGLHALTFRGLDVLPFRGLHDYTSSPSEVYMPSPSEDCTSSPSEDYTFRGLHILAYRGLHVLAFRGLHALAFRGQHVLPFRGLHVLTFIGLHTLTFRGLHVLPFRGLHVLAIRGLHVLTFRGLHALTFRGLHGLTFRGIHVLAFKGLHTLTFRGLHVLASRGLHALAYRGLHVLAFIGLHALAFRGLHVLAFKGLHVHAFRGKNALACRGLHVLAFRGLHVLTFRGLHALAFRGLHVLPFRGLHVLIFIRLHALTFRGLHVLPFRRLHVLAIRGLHLFALAFVGLHALTFRGLHVLAFRRLHTLTFIGLHAITFMGLHICAFRELKFAFISSWATPLYWRVTNCASTTKEGGYHAATMHTGARFHSCRYKEMSADHAHQHDQSYIDMDDVSMHVAQLISDAIHYLQGSRPQDTQWTRRSPTGPWGFQLWLRASISPTGNPLMKKILGLQAPMELTSPSPPARSCHRDIAIVHTRHPVDPEKSNRFYGVSVAPNKVIRPPINRTFIKKYCAPQGGAGRDTIIAWGWPAAGNRCTTATSKAPQLIYKSWSVAYDLWSTRRRPSPKPKVARYLGYACI
ncbi:Dynein heavy chain [Glycine soja]